MPELGSVAFITLGCAKNEVDSQHMARRLVRAGYAIDEDPERADVVIVNTCSFIQAATEESIEAILEVAGYESVVSGKARLVVAGCMPTRYGGELEAELPEVSRFVSCEGERDIVDALDSLLGIERIGSEERLVGRAGSSSLSGSFTTSYVKISDGCDRFCSYCTIPYIRGRYHSFEEADIVDEVSSLVERGAREIILIAQDTGRWGSDFEQPRTLASLLGGLAKAFPHTWFRVMYIQPEGVTDELLETIAAHDNVCNYLDIPFQHANASILEAMNRRGSAGEYLELVEHVRQRIPDVVLRTTLIAGFPGETEEHFEELCDFVCDLEFDYVGVFPYSREEATRAYRLEGQLDEDEKLSRAQQVRDLADTVSSSVIARRIGREYDVVVCGCEEDGQLFGRTMGQAPDVDGVTYLDAGKAGDVVRVRIDDVLLYEMEGTVIG